VTLSPSGRIQSRYREVVEGGRGLRERPGAESRSPAPPVTLRLVRWRDKMAVSAVSGDARPAGGAAEGQVSLPCPA
jgi:hypothetical protein